MSKAGPAVPWSLSDARTTFLTTVGGGGLLLLAWWGSSGTGKLGHQTTWAAVGVAAVVVIGAGNLLWVMSGRRAVRLRCDNLVERIQEADLPITAPSTSVLSAMPGPLVALAGSSRYHRESCLLVRGKNVHTVPTGVRPLDGLRPCEMCEP